MSEPLNNEGWSAPSDRAKDAARDFLYRYVKPAIDQNGKRIWELDLNRQILEFYFDKLLS